MPGVHVGLFSAVASELEHLNIQRAELFRERVVDRIDECRFRELGQSGGERTEDHRIECFGVLELIDGNGVRGDEFAFRFQHRKGDFGLGGIENGEDISFTGGNHRAVDFFAETHL